LGDSGFAYLHLVPSFGATLMCVPCQFHFNTAKYDEYLKQLLAVSSLYMLLFKEGSMWCQYQFFDLNSLSLYVLLGAIATAGALVVGLSAFHVGDCRLSQKMMRNRVGFQAATVALMAGSAYLQGKT
jgi:low temperature requirement protein LtrA